MPSVEITGVVASNISDYIMERHRQPHWKKTGSGLTCHSCTLESNVNLLGEWAPRNTLLNNFHKSTIFLAINEYY